jgi:hypothetical protein
MESRLSTPFFAFSKKTDVFQKKLPFSHKPGKPGVAIFPGMDYNGSKWRCFVMNLTKSARCHIRMQSRWAGASAVCMGISVFIRTVYYFGLINLRDLSGFAVVMEVILPMVVAAGYLIMIKGLQLNSPILFGGLIGLYAANYLTLMNTNVTGIIGGVLLIITAAVFIITGLGYIPNRIWVIASATILALFRFLVIDLFGYILPLNELRPVAYLPEASNLFGFWAVALMAPALQVSLLHSSSASSEVANADGDAAYGYTADEEETESAEDLSSEAPAESEKEAVYGYTASEQDEDVFGETANDSDNLTQV